MPRPRVLGEAVTVPIVLNRELYEKLRAEALRRNTSMSQVVRFLIDAYLFDAESSSGNNNESKEESPLRELDLSEFNESLKSLETKVEYALRLSENIRIVKDHVEIPQGLNLKNLKDLWQSVRKRYGSIFRYLDKEERLMTEKKLVYLYKAIKDIDNKIEDLKRQYVIRYVQ